MNVAVKSSHPIWRSARRQRKEDSRERESQERESKFQGRLLVKISEGIHRNNFNVGMVYLTEGYHTHTHPHPPRDHAPHSQMHSVPLVYSASRPGLEL
jgi:hypothetical protein